MIKKCPDCNEIMLLKRQRKTLYFYFGMLIVFLGFMIESTRRYMSLKENAIWGGALLVCAVLSIIERNKTDTRKEYYLCKKCGLVLDVDDNVSETDE